MSIVSKYVVFVLGALCTGGAAASEQELSKQILRSDGWVGYEVPMVAGAGSPCCFEFHGKKASRTGCDLDGRSWNIGRDDKDPRADDSVLAVYLHVANARIDKVRAFGASCAIRDSDKLRRLEHVDSADSIALLAHAAADSREPHDGEDAELAALAMHADAAATPALAQLADSGHPRKLREQALFWSGQLRGVEGAHLVERYATTDADPELRAEAIFALSESRGLDAYASILGIARTDASSHVREQALFWMAQMNDPRAHDDILAAIDREPSDDVREQAVFALSQLKDADKALIALVRGHYPRKVKQQALFWLGQSGSDEALHFIDEVLSTRGAGAHDS